MKRCFGVLRDETVADAAQVGRWWKRDGLTEVDIVYRPADLLGAWR